MDRVATGLAEKVLADRSGPEQSEHVHGVFTGLERVLADRYGLASSERLHGVFVGLDKLMFSEKSDLGQSEQQAPRWSEHLPQTSVDSVGSFEAPCDQT